ncbi:MAG: PAS-domain containing protein [Erythrobacter sp.]|uniref:PAS domain-containing sensor histidine kinase n=1 Tax=Erythrobacter sp. TaxID=1042 RepID=UPI002639C436|nr:PAS domain-containing sensor histidine kinase [Erythrobacter sp.]MDJ0977382.1 PAS-domain containing protein [Erythrobacter sp.]
MEITPLAAAVIGLVLAAWTVAAAVFALRASGQVRRVKGLQSSLKRMQALIETAPSIPMLVRVDGRIEAPERLARWLGLAEMPEYLSELASGGDGLTADQVEELNDHVRHTQRSAAPFQMSLMLPGSRRSLALHGALADPNVSPAGAALVWVFDFTESEDELSRLRQSTAQAEAGFRALLGLIEEAPMPMWFRGPDMAIQLVNRAYVEAVAAGSADAVVQGRIELLEDHKGRSPGDVARGAFERQERTERIVASTIHGERRTLKVSDLPLGSEGVAGYAIDIEEQQQVRRDFRAYRAAQRAMLDQLSIGVAQFNDEERLIYANLPFRRLFELGADVGDGSDEGAMAFERFLAEAREKNRTPEVRDFPEWRRERTGWFELERAHEENWPLPGGTHLRIVAQPMPDGGLVLIGEDRTESLALSATRDTLLRTRTATLDSLFEALAIFAPDGSVQLWNRRFAPTWGLNAEFLDSHPSATELLDAIGDNLVDPSETGQIGAVVRAATLDRHEESGQVELSDGRSLRFAGVPLPDGNGLLTVLDITDSEKAERALRERAAALEEADSVKTRFLANMSYEFRNPLTTIRGFAEMLASGAGGDLSHEAGDYVDAILTSVDQLTEQVENVLDLSQSEAGLMPISKEKIELLPFLTKLVREREAAIIEAGLGLDLKGKKSRIAMADPRQLARAVGNLLDNAISGTPEQGHILIEVPKPGEDEDWSASIVISDNGRGISKATLAEALGAGRESAEGERATRSGLGIPLARQLIEAQGGRLELTSKKGAGTTAIIRLP